MKITYNNNKTNCDKIKRKTDKLIHNLNEQNLY